MWVILKFEKKKLSLLRKDFLDKLGGVPKYYLPKLKIQKYSKNKLYDKEILLLGDYMLCFHSAFVNKSTIELVKYCKGVKYFLNGFSKSQIEIERFINKCKSNEDDKGYIKQSFFDFGCKKKFKFLSGPFTNEIFNIIQENQFKIKASIGNLNTIISKEDYLYTPI